MSIKVNSNFSLGSKTPLDSRQVVETLDDLLALDTNIIYNGLECYVSSLDCKYKYHEDYNETDTGHWKLNISEGEGVTIDDETISTYKTWSSEKILIETAENYAIFEGIVGDGYYSTNIGNDDITSTPASLYGGWTLDTVTSNGDIESILSNYSNATTKKVISFSDILSVNDISDTSISLEDTTKNSGGQSYKFILVWENDSKESDSKTYTSLDELGLTTDATFQDVVDALPKGGSALLGVKEFTNYQTIFPYDEGNDQFARVHIVKGVADGSCMYARWFRKDGAKEAIASFNINDNKFYGWRPIFTNYYTSLAQLGLTAPVSIGEAFNAMPDKSQLMLNVNNAANADATVTDAPHNQGVLVINKHNNGRFSIEFNYSLGGNGNTIRKWIGTLKGTDGTGLNWKEVAYLDDHGMKSYSSLTDLELDTTATINDIVGKMANTSMFVYKTDVFDLSQYENLQLATVTIIKQSANRVQAIMTDKETGNLYIGYMNSSNKFVGWTKLVANEIIHTDLSGNLAGITTVLDLVNALLTEYRATSPKKPIRFVSGEFTKTTLTDLPVTYGLLQITVAGWDVIEVRLAHSANGFKTMYYGFVNRISGEESISSITWKEVTTKSIYNSVAELNKAKGTSIELVNGEDNTQKIVDALSTGEQFVSFYHNNANQNRFGIDASYGNLIHEIRITKCLDADLTANYATVTAFMNTGCVMSRIYYKTYSTAWSSTKDYVESLT